MDERTLELIHGEVDGTNSAEEHRELLQILESEPEARREHARITELNDWLAAEPALEPPADLRSAVLARLFPPRRIAPRPARVRTWLGAAAMAATVAGVAFILLQAPDIPELDPAALAGTIGQPAAGASVQALSLDEHGVSGVITVQLHEHGFTLDIDLDASAPVHVVASAHRSELALAGYLPRTGGPASVSDEGGSIVLLHRGHQHYGLVVSSTATMLDLEIRDGDRVLHQRSLELGVPPADGR
jgi:anti-sigma factor RsiW